MNYRLIKTFTISLILAMSVFALPAFADGNLGTSGKNLQNVATKAGTTEGDISSIIGTVINAVLTLVGLAFLMLMVYAGMLWMTARGESEPVEKARKIITGSLIGLVIVMSAYAITAFVTASFNK